MKRGRLTDSCAEPFNGTPYGPLETNYRIVQTRDFVEIFTEAVMGGISPPGDCLSSSDNSRVGSIPHTPDKSRRGAGALAVLEESCPLPPSEISKMSANVTGTPKEWIRMSVIWSYR